MIRYFCDFSNRDITNEQWWVCQQVGAEFAKNHQEVPYIREVVQELWHPDFDDKIFAYWDQKAALLLSIEQEKERRLAKNRKEFFKPKASQKAG